MHSVSPPPIDAPANAGRSRWLLFSVLHCLKTRRGEQVISRLQETWFLGRRLCDEEIKGGATPGFRANGLFAPLINKRQANPEGRLKACTTQHGCCSSHAASLEVVLGDDDRQRSALVPAALLRRFFWPPRSISFTAAEGESRFDINMHTRA